MVPESSSKNYFFKTKKESLYLANFSAHTTIAITTVPATQLALSYVGSIIKDVVSCEV